MGKCWDGNSLSSCPTYGRQVQLTLIFLEFSLSYGRPEGVPDILVSTWIIVQTNDHGDAAKEEFEAAVVGGIDGRSAQAEGSESDGSQPDYFE